MGDNDVAQKERKSSRERELKAENEERKKRKTWVQILRQPPIEVKMKGKKEEVNSLKTHFGGADTANRPLIPTCPSPSISRTPHPAGFSSARGS